MIIKLDYHYRYRDCSGKLISREASEYFVVQERVESGYFYDFVEAHIKEMYPTLETFIPLCLNKMPAVYVPEKS